MTEFFAVGLATATSLGLTIGAVFVIDVVLNLVTLHKEEQGNLSSILQLSVEAVGSSMMRLRGCSAHNVKANQLGL